MAKQFGAIRKIFSRMQEVRGLHEEVSVRLDRVRSDARRLGGAAYEAKQRAENLVRHAGGSDARVPEHRKAELRRFRDEADKIGRDLEAARKEEKQLTQERDALKAELSGLKAQALATLGETFTPAHLKAFVMEIIAAGLASIRAIETRLQALTDKRRELSEGARELKAASPVISEEELLKGSVDDHAGRLESEGFQHVATDDLLDRVNQAIERNQRKLEDEKRTLVVDLTAAVNLHARSGQIACAAKLKEALDLDADFGAAVSDLCHEVMTETQIAVEELFGLPGGASPVMTSLFDNPVLRERLALMVKSALPGTGGNDLAG